MGIGFLYLLLAIIGIGFLIFIHELGHYLVARFVGMRVEVFSVGLGRPIKQWTHNRVVWQIGWIPFGGYVKIAGMEKEGKKDLMRVEGGFYTKGPLARIAVAFAGPLANFIFAVFAFSIIWGMGGREQPFSQHTKLVGFVDTASPLYKSGVRPGDVLTYYGGHAYRGLQDVRYTGIADIARVGIQGYHLNYLTGEEQPFSFVLSPYFDKRMEGTSTVGIVASANYVIYKPSTFFQKSSPIQESGIQAEDRVVWVDGETVFSSLHLVHLLNDGYAFLQIKRGDQYRFARVPRITFADLRVEDAEIAAFVDWQYEAGLANSRLKSLAFIPYFLSYQGVVQAPLNYFNHDFETVLPRKEAETLYSALQPGDQIVGVDGMAVQSVTDILTRLQKRHASVIVERKGVSKAVSWKEADFQFIHGTNWQDLRRLVTKAAVLDNNVTAVGDFVYLKPVALLPMKDFPMSAELKSKQTIALDKERKAIGNINNVEEKARALSAFNRYENRLMLGISLLDKTVIYNPSPWQQCLLVLKDMRRTLGDLFTGKVAPKYLSGPVGIIHVMQSSWSLGFKEALFWLGFISLNLGVMNLLPIPVLDGGHICFGVVEFFTRRRLHPKTMQRLVLPFVALLVFFFLYVTFYDIKRFIHFW